ncbi:hypothetical protein POM88_030724 [Heracleum sosnowskyi]|uniref:NOT2/NOT3/NOT5 C-terminal domain-containing protein n=1 Tax=Heracleum sosnowskyi TaxID=360622 RepID=A0AAD8HXG9_9APIA|nr:hypothetical protein POM88_030724 [Heracleum sosnowskyi]
MFNRIVNLFAWLNPYQYHDSSRFCLVNKFNRKELRDKFLCYYAKQPPSLYHVYFTKFQLDTLFYIFYSMPKEEAQLYAANELHNRGWFYHREQRRWFMRAANMEPFVKTNTYERGSYISFDPNTWETIPKDNFVVHYDLSSPVGIDLVHADHLFSDIKKRCKLQGIITEVDRILRPKGTLIVRDDVETITEIEKIAKSIQWKVQLTYSKDNGG